MSGLVAECCACKEILSLALLVPSYYPVMDTNSRLLVSQEDLKHEATEGSAILLPPK